MKYRQNEIISKCERKKYRQFTLEVSKEMITSLEKNKEFFMTCKLEIIFGSKLFHFKEIRMSLFVATKM